MRISWNDCCLRAAIKLRGKYSEEQVLFVGKDFGESLRFFLSNPHLSKEGVYLEGFIKFLLRKKKVEECLADPNLPIEKREPLEKVLRYLEAKIEKNRKRYEKTQRQASEGENNA